MATEEERAQRETRAELVTVADQLAQEIDSDFRRCVSKLAISCRNVV